MTTPVGSTTQSTTPAPAAPTNTVKQPDGSTFEIPIPTSTYDPVSKKWQSNATEADRTQATTINRKYGQALDADDFMSLLVAQMRFQDPSKPADTTAMMQQTASMAMLERVNEMTTSATAMADAAKGLKASNQELMAYYAAQAVEQRMSTAVGMIGATVTYSNPTDASKTREGLVDSVKFSESGPILSVSGTDVPLGSVKSVKAPATAPASAPSTGSAPSAGTTQETSGATTGNTATDGTSGSAATDTTGSTGTPA